SNGKPADAEVEDAAGNRQTFAGGLGQTLGSTIGSILGGNSLEGRALGSTVVGTLGHVVGDLLQESGNWAEGLVEEGIDGIGTVLDTALGDTVGILGDAGGS